MVAAGVAVYRETRLRGILRLLHAVRHCWKWAATAFVASYRIEDVPIASGDYVVADRDGIVIIPQALVEEVTVEAEEVLRTENVVRKAILQGVDPVAAYLKYRKF
jgi:4-hydroxy-4-methyl-2-oxoglutarate aldolase